MNGITTKLPRAAAVVLIGGASLVAVIAIVLVTVILKPLTSTASAQQNVSMAPGSTIPIDGDSSSAQDDTPEARGELPTGTTPFDEQYAGINNLSPDLIHALREASTAAVAEGVDVYVNSGWRSREYQEQLYREAIAKYGSAKEASRWVASPDSSAHVSGDAVDIGNLDATAWFSQFGASYGLCQTYANESWHYEFHPSAATEGCPAMSTDAAIH